MRIVINALSARTGGGLIYLNNLLRNLERIDEHNDYTVLVTGDNRRRCWVMPNHVWPFWKST